VHEQRLRSVLFSFSFHLVALGKRWSPTAWRCGAKELWFGVGLDEIGLALIPTYTLVLYSPPWPPFPLYPSLPYRKF
jgi:hypothetical protein